MAKSSCLGELNSEELESPDEIKVGTLSIVNTKTKSCAADYWSRSHSPNPPMPPREDSTKLRIEIRSASIMPPQDANPKLKRYVVYEISIYKDTSISDPIPSVIHRRYSDFRLLYINLKHSFPDLLSPIHFPSKVLVGNFSRLLIEERSAAFEHFLAHVTSCNLLLESTAFENFIHSTELTQACKLLDERRTENAIPLLEKCFFLCNKIYMDRSRPVLLLLCRLVVACSMTPVPHPSADRWSTLALHRYDTLCDVDLLTLYVPLLHSCSHLWWQMGRDQKQIVKRLEDMSRKGININKNISLTQAIHRLDPRTEMF